jgi:hypothetical protein
MLRRLLTRFGYTALGVVYVALGGVALYVAIAGSRERASGFAGTFRLLLNRPSGPTVVTWIAAGLAAFVLARLADAADRKWPRLDRLIALAVALGHGALLWMVISLLLRMKRGPTFSHSAIAWLLSRPWGATALEVIGIAIIALGVYQLWQAASGRLRQRFKQRQLGSAHAYAIHVGRFGLAARGLVTAIVGWFLVRAARDLDPREFHEVGGALEVLHKMRFGGLLLALAGTGLCAYGAYLVLLGFFRRPS